ncbi:hypothetical protein Tco_0480863 [Tanacetum coccineum]
MFIKYSTGQIPPKKSKGKGSQGKKTTDTSKADVDMFEEYDYEPARKSVSLTKAAEEEAARQVHARIMTESVLEPSRRRPLEQLATDTMKALKERVPNEFIVVPTTSSEGTGTKPGVLDEEKVTFKANVILDWGSEQESEYSKEDNDEEEDDDHHDNDDDDDDKSINLEKTDDKETEDEFVHSEENVQNDDEETDDEETNHELVHADKQVNDNEDEKMTNVEDVEDVDTRNGDEEITNAVKADAEKIKEAKDDNKKAKLPPTSSCLFDTTDAEINSLLDPSILTPIPETPSVAPATTLLPLYLSPPYHLYYYPLHVVIQRVYVLEKDVQELKEADNTTTLSASLISEIPSAANAYLRSSLGDALQKVKNQLPKFLPKAVSDFDTLVIQSMVKNALEKTPFPIDKSRSYLTYDKHQALFDALLNSILFDDAFACGQAYPEKVLRKRDRDNEDPLAGPNQEEPVKEPIFKIASDDIEQTIDDVDQPPDDSTQTKDQAPKQYWSKQPPMPPTPDLEWNKQGDHYPIDLTKPLPLKDHPGYLTITAEYFFNNDFEFLKSSDPEKKYTTSITKTKAAQYEIVGIENMVPTLWSATKCGQCECQKLHGYGHLEEIAVRRADRQLFQLDDSDIVDLIVALCMFTRSLIIKRRVKDLQLGVESYQKKLNITAPQKTFLEIEFKELYTPSYKPPGMRERRIIRNLERLVGARELEMDYRLTK